MSNDQIIGGHPLDGADEDKCYDVLLTERNSLLTAKRASEDDAIKGIIKFSSAALLLVPGAIVAWKIPISGTAIYMLGTGFVLFVLSVIMAFAEQFLSSVAYDKQLNVVTEYYSKRSHEVSHPLSAKRVRLALLGSFFLFSSALLMSSLGLGMLAEDQVMAQKPTSTPTPPPRPSPGRPEPAHVPGHKDGGRSIPPQAPPPPPSKKG
jgi:hypothetical protein